MSNKNLKIVHYPHLALKTKSKPVVDFNNELVTITEQMINIMHEEQGIGLAANQVGIPLRIFIMETSNMDKPYIFINPELSPVGTDTVLYSEGCLSFPGLTQEKTRLQEIKVQWQDLEGKSQEKVFKGLDAICVQHENDHINGITFIDDLSPLKKQFALKKLQKPSKKTLKLR